MRLLREEEMLSSNHNSLLTVSATYQRAELNTMNYKLRIGPLANAQSAVMAHPVSRQGIA